MGDSQLAERRRIYVEVYGKPPWRCYGCGELVEPPRYVIHHIDCDHSNDDPRNLAAMHPRCHTSLHSRGRITTAETRRRISETMKERGIAPSIEVRRLGGAATARSEFARARRREGASRPWTAERRVKHKQALQQAHQERSCPHCDAVMKPGPLGMHIKFKHEGARKPPLTPEHRRKIGKSLQGRQVDDVTRAKISMKARGRRFTEEHRAALRAAWIKRKTKD